MKLNKLFLGMAMSLGLFACSDDDMNGGESLTGNGKGNTYVAVSVDLKNMNSRATTEVGKPQESVLNSVYVMWADGDKIGQVVSTSEKGENKDKYLLEVTPGTHTFYAVVNPDVVPKKEDPIATYFETAKACAIAEVTNTGEGGKGFMMSNVTGNSIEVRPSVSKEEALNGSQNNLQLAVERVSAKVTVVCENYELTDRTGTQNAGKILKDKTTYQLAGDPTHFYRMKNTAEAYDALEKAGTLDYTTIQETTPSVAVCFEKGEEDYIYRNADPAYCFENLHANNNYWQHNTTYLVLKTTFIPNKVVDLSSTAPEPTKLNPNYNAETPASFYLVTIGSLAGHYVLKTELDAYLLANNNKLPEGIDAYDTRPYENGVCYFGPIWVGQPEMNVSSYAPVDRNHWYNLSITKMVMPGFPEPGDVTPEPTPDPENPDEFIPLEPSTYVAVTLNVLPWNFVSKDMTLD